MKITGENPDKVILWSINRALINNAKRFLIILEDFKSDGLLDDNYYQKLRGRILSDANDSYREVETLIKNFNIQ